MINFKKTYPTPKEHTNGTNTCEFIILHHTGTKEGTITWVLNGLYYRDDFASCHYVVDINGDIYKLWNDTDILWHAGTSAWKWKTNLNKYSIWIEIIWPLSNGWFTDQQRESVANLVQYLAKLYAIPKENVLRHKDIAPKRKWDVADTFWNWGFWSYDQYINSLFIKNTNMASKYTEIMENVIKETGFKPIFGSHEWDQPLTEKEIKELIEIALARFFERLSWK